MARLTREEKAYLRRLSGAARREVLRAHRKPPVPVPRSYDAKRAARKKQDRRDRREARDEARETV